MKKLTIISVLILLVLGLVACNSDSDAGGAVENIDGVPEGVQGGKRVAVVRNLPSDDHTVQFFDGARSEGESFGFHVDTFIANNDDVRFQELVAQAIQGNYDGLIISHGKEEYSYDMLAPAIEKGLEVVTFDTVTIKDGQTFPEITSTFQDDFKLAELSLDEVVALSENGEAVRILKLWFGPGVPPLDRRETIYKQYEEQGLIETLEVIGPTNFDDVQGDIAAKVSAVLARYQPGEIDAIWGSWDEMAKGAYIAMKENNRMEIELISIDISNQDINMMMEEGSNWRSTAAVDPYLIGVVNMRLLAKKFAGEDTPAEYDLEAMLIRQSDLTSETNMTNLDEYVDGWGQSDAFNEPWMDLLREAHAK
ncbi:MAG: sugar ABC transporter substrate-binding protein [Bacillus sp. (in: Bacteria)]|nr:sugar ABC transporter substrate-binding protein [Bacillus sp. (in: firmicutes)]